MGEKALLRACREMRDAENIGDFAASEIVGSPAEFWLDDRRIAAATVHMGLAFCLFRSEGIGSDYEIHTLNSWGREFAETGSLAGLAPGRKDP